MATGLRKFYAPEFVFGPGARRLAGRHAANLGARRVLVVTDPGVVAAGWTGDVLASLDAEGLERVVYDRVTPNPRVHEILDGAELYRREGCNAIVAVGGGSPIDCAKGIGILSANGGQIRDYEGVDEVPLPGPPLVCVPTTAGTAADISQFAIVSDPERRLKFAIVSKKVVPDVALLDPDTTATLSPFLTACTGLDALTHALEALASNAASPLTDIHALEAIRLATSALPRVVRDPADAEARADAMLASLEAGLAFSNASLGAVHAMAHSLGGYLDAPHGLCNALLLPHVVAFNHADVPEAYERAARAMGLDLRGVPSGGRRDALVGALLDLERRVGFDTRLADVGVHPTDLPELAKHAMADACIVTNPRRPVQRDLEALYAEAL